MANNACFDFVFKSCDVHLDPVFFASTFSLDILIPKAQTSGLVFDLTGTGSKLNITCYNTLLALDAGPP